MMFAEDRDLVAELKKNDAHFSRLYDKHNDLDNEISKLENDPVTSVSRDTDIEKLKKEKLALKDELYQIVEKHKAA